MKSLTDTNIKHIYRNPVYMPRIFTDAFFEDEPISRLYKGEADRAARFIEDFQLMNPSLWTLFVNQYRIRPDHTDRGWRGEYWGKMMRGACWTYKYTRNPELYKVLTDTVLDIMTTADPDGRISSYPLELELDGWDMWSRKYVLLGMQYFYEICRDTKLKAELLISMSKQADYIVEHIGSDDGKKPILLATRHWGGTNSASILEPFVRLYSLTGDEKYYDFAKYIIETGGCEWGNIFNSALKGEKMPFEYPVTKAYEMMSFFEGVIEFYRITGDEDCKTAFLNFVEGVMKSDLTVIGCCGCTHELFDNSTEKQTEPSEQVMQETCVSVTWMKVCYQALCLTGDAKYADAMETTFYNALLGSINFNKNPYLATNDKNKRNPDFKNTEDFILSLGGLPFDSYSPLYKSTRNRLIGGYKVMEGGTAYGCCACIGSAGTALLPNSAVMLMKDGVVFNHYMSGSITTRTPDGKEIAFEVATDYPYDGKVAISWKGSTDNSFLISLRIPSYVDSAIIDGAPTKVTPNSYLDITASPVGSITLELKIAVELLSKNGKVALKRGAIAYALDERNQDVNGEACEKITAISEAEPDFDCRSALNVTFANGNTLKLTDYASAGADWNMPKSTITVWMDTGD